MLKMEERLSKPSDHPEVVSELFIREFWHQSKFTMSFLFFIYSLFHTNFCCFDVRCNNISVSISSLESDSELRVMSSAIAHFARLQETASQCVLTLCHAVFPVLRLPALPCSALRLAVSQYVLTPCHTVFPMLRLPALLCPFPASACVSMCAQP